jgi:hypothetical protein
MPRRSSFIRLFTKSGIHVGIEHLQWVMQGIATGNRPFDPQDAPKWRGKYHDTGSFWRAGYFGDTD